MGASDAAADREEQSVEWPEPRLDRFEPWYLDFHLSPEFVRNDRKHWDDMYASAGGLGRIAIDVEFIGEDGFAEVFDSLTPAPKQ